MDSGGFADPDQRDAEIGQMLYQQFKENGTPTTILLCSTVVRYDDSTPWLVRNSKGLVAQ